MNALNLLINEISWLPYNVRQVLEPALLITMVLVSIALIVIVLMQKATSDNIGVVGGGDSETYLGKNKGENKERNLKILTIICGALLLIISVLYFIIKL